MSDRIAVFNDGRIEQVGTPAEIYERPATPFVAGFVGTSNLLTPAAPRGAARRAPACTPCGRRRSARAGRRDAVGRRRASPTGPSARSCTPARDPCVVALDAGAELVARSRRTDRRGGAEVRPRRPRRARVARGDGSGARPEPAPPRPAGRPPRESQPTAGGHDETRRVRARSARAVARRCSPWPRAARAVSRRGRRRRAGDQRRRPSGRQQSVGAGEGEVNIIAWAGLRRERRNDPKTSTGSRRSRRRPAARRRQDRRHLRRDGHADEDRPVRRRLGLGRRDAAADLRRRRRAGRTPTCVPNYATVAPFLKDRPWNSVNGADVRHAARLGREPADVQHGRRDARARLAGASVFDPTRPYKGKVTGVRLADLHRRRRAVPEGDEARPEDHRPVRAGRRPSSTRPSTCSRRSAAIVGEYWRDSTKEHQALRERQHRARHDLADHREPRRRPTRRSRSGDACPKEGSTGWSDTWMVAAQGQAPELHVQVDELDRLARGQRRRSRSTSVRRRRRPKACDETTDKTHCTTYHATTRPTPTRSRTGRRRRSDCDGRTAVPSARTTRPGPRRGRRSRAD